MKVLLLGAAGKIGSRIFDELVRRSHHVTAVYRRPPASPDVSGLVDVVVADISEPKTLASLIDGHDAVISAIGPGSLGEPEIIKITADNLVQVMTASNVDRILVVGGAGTLEIEPGVMRLDAPGYPEQYRPAGMMQKSALATYRESPLDWTYISPPIIIQPGERTGEYRISGDQVLYNDEGASLISMEDYAVATVDILDDHKHSKQRITVGY